MRTTICSFFVCATAILGCMTPGLPAQAQPVRCGPEDLEEVFGMLGTHGWDRPYDGLHGLDSLVLRSMNEEALRKELEHRFIRVLQTSTNRYALQYACRQLYLIGTPAAVPAISRWLADSAMSHMARYALAHIEGPEAVRALQVALGNAEGDQKAGIIISLAERGDPSHLSVFMELAGSSEKEVALAAVRAIGMTGNADQIPFLQETGQRPEEVSAESVNAILAIAGRMLESGNTREAGKVFRTLYSAGSSPHIRMAGLKGMMQAEDAKPGKLLVEALSGTDAGIRGFAGRLVADRGYTVNTSRLTRSLKKIPPAGQAILIDALGKRGAFSSKAEILAFGESPDREVRLAVIRALGFLGDAGDIAYLAKRASGGGPEERNAARVSLSQLEGDAVHETMISQVRTSPPPVRAVLINSLTQRGAVAVREELLPYLGDPEAQVRKAVLEYLRRNGLPQDLELLAGFSRESDHRSERRLAYRALEAICSRYGERCEPQILSLLQEAQPELKESLVTTLNLIGTKKALESCIAFTGSNNEDISKAAVRTLAAWQDSTALEALREITYGGPDLSRRVLAFRGYFRLFRNTALDDREKMREYRRLIEEAAERREEKILVLSAFQEIGSVDALKRIEKYLYDPEMTRETCLAILRITDFLDPEYREDVAVAMMQVQEVSRDENILADVQRRIRKFGIDPAAYYDPPGMARAPAGKRIVFISGPMDHAWYDAHEYPKDLLFLKQCIEQSPDCQDVRVDFYLTTDALDLDRIRGADAIVVHSSADRAPGEVHSLFPNHRADMRYTPAERAYYTALDSLVGKGMGVVVLHYAVWTDFPESREYMSKWVGGYYDDHISRVRMDSVATMLETPSHPVCNGISPWHLREEYYINQVYSREQKVFTPLLAANLPLERGGDPEFHTVGWAVERPDGGRGIGYTGCHTHSYLYQEDYRKFVVNAIAWAAGIPVPGEGIQTRIPEGWDH